VGRDDAVIVIAQFRAEVPLQFDPYPARSGHRSSYRHNGGQLV
jgi:hypothetical protein